jgi:hypothetical protein
MNKRAAHARVLLASLEAKLEHCESQDKDIIRVTRQERAYLLSVCKAALDGSPDALRLDRQAGGQQRIDEGLSEARRVHELRKLLGTMRAACEAVGKETHRDGSKSGAVEKNYRAHRAALEASDRFYVALAAGTTPRDEDIALILSGRNQGK